MSRNTHVQAWVSPELKKAADAVLNAMGLKTAEAIRLFLKQVVNTGGLPFQPPAKIPDAKTWLLIYRVTHGELQPVRAGSHSGLFR